MIQAAIAKELGVPRPTITRWLKDQIGQNEQTSPDVQNGLSNTKPCRYLVVCQSVEKFRPPDGITFPLIIAKELGVDHRTIGRWLSENNSHTTRGILPKGLNNGHNALSAGAHPLYLVVCQSVD